MTAADTGSRAFQDALGEALVQAHGRQLRRRRRRTIVLVVSASVVGIIAIVSGAMTLVGSSPAAADAIRVVSNPDGTRTVTILDPSATPDAISSALDRASILNRTTGETTGPSRVGTLLSITIDDSTGLSSSNRSITLPVGFTSVVSLTVGVAAKAGEQYAQPSNAFDRGEPLANLAPTDDVAIIAAAAQARGLKVIIIDPAGNVSNRAAVGRTLIPPFMTSAKTIQIRLLE